MAGKRTPTTGSCPVRGRPRFRRRFPMVCVNTKTPTHCNLPAALSIMRCAGARPQGVQWSTSAAARRRCSSWPTSAGTRAWTRCGAVSGTRRCSRTTPERVCSSCIKSDRNRVIPLGCRPCCLPLSRRKRGGSVCTQCARAANPQPQLTKGKNGVGVHAYARHPSPHRDAGRDPSLLTSNSAGSAIRALGFPFGPARVVAAALPQRPSIGRRHYRWSCELVARLDPQSRCRPK